MLKIGLNPSRIKYSARTWKCKRQRDNIDVALVVDVASPQESGARIGVEFEDSAALAEWNALHNGDSADGIARAESELPNSSWLGCGPGHEASLCPCPYHISSP